MNMSIPIWLKPGLWGVAVGVVAVLIVQFAAGWVVTSGTAQEMANRKAEKAVISSLTPICVARFKQEKNQQALLVSLEKEDYWQRSDFVEERGWATMPGSSEPNDAVAEACSDELLKLAEKK